MSESGPVDSVRTPEDVLGPLEAAIMRSLWARREASVADVHEDLAAAGRPLAYTTVMTVLARLHDKGIVERRQEGRHHVYHPATDEDGLVSDLAARAADATVARYGTAALRQFALRLDALDPSVRQRLLDLAEHESDDPDR